MVFEELSLRAAVLLAVILIGGILWRTMLSRRRASVAMPALPVTAQSSSKTLGAAGTTAGRSIGISPPRFCETTTR
jgi:hypothetical protein